MISFERELSTAWMDAHYPSPSEPEQLPEPVQVAQAGGAAFGVFPAMKSKASRTGEISEVAKMAPADIAAGAGKGLITGGIGTPGDLESLIRGVRSIFTRTGDVTKVDAFLSGLEEQTILPTSSDVSRWLDENIGPVVPPAAPMAKERAGVAEAGQLAGELVSGPGTLVKGGKAAAKTAAATGKFVKPKVGEMLDAYMRRSGMQLELTAYHGTPHRFAPEEGAPLGRFRSEKIGTGEGAQAFGHGLYFAESPGVAKGYRQSLTEKIPVVFDGKSYGDSPRDQTRLMNDLRAWATNNKRDPDVYEMAGDWLVGQNGDAYLALKLATPDLGFGPEHLKAIKELSPLIPKVDATGSLYTVDIPDEMVGKMLDWDKPLSQQSKNVRDAIKKANPGLFQSGKYSDRLSSASAIQSRYPGRVISDLFEQANASAPAQRYGKPADDMYGIDYWALALRVSEGDPAKASQFMREAGIPGIRYLDAGSRDGGAGTRNIVVFPGGENQIKIIKAE